jgi:hypothetical protein
MTDHLSLERGSKLRKARIDNVKTVTKHTAQTNPDRESRILHYQDRAERGLPLFAD